MFLAKKSRNLSRRPIVRPVKANENPSPKADETVAKKAPAKKGKAKKESETVEEVAEQKSKEE